MVEVDRSVKLPGTFGLFLIFWIEVFLLFVYFDYNVPKMTNTFCHINLVTKLHRTSEYASMTFKTRKELNIVSLSVQCRTTDSSQHKNQTLWHFKKCIPNSCLNRQTLLLTVRKTQLYTQTPFPGSKHQLCRNSSASFIEFSSTRTCESHSDQHIPQDPPFVYLS